jgi:hypothetical protein
VEINRYNLDFLQVCRQNWAATSLQFATTQEKPVTYSFVNPSGMFIWQKDLLFTEKKKQYSCCRHSTACGTGITSFFY